MNKLKAVLTVSAGFTLLSVLGCVFTKPYVEPPLPEGGTMVPGGNLTEKLAWLEKGADSRNLYIVEVNANENVAPRTLEYSGATDVTIVLRGVGENRTLRLASHGAMFTVKPNVTLILDNNITLQGHSQNTGPMVEVNGGEFLMRTGSNIIGNDRGSGNGGGVYVRSGTFVMTGGFISGNTAENGGGVYVAGPNGVFQMQCGTISDNIANKQGGGVYSNSYKVGRDADGSRMNISNFKMGVKSKSSKSGCAMITSNIARKEGGGIYYTYESYGDGYFFNHGIVTGYGSDPTRGNVVKDEGGKVISGKGHTLSRSGTCYGVQYSQRVEAPCGRDIDLGYMNWSDTSVVKPEVSATAAPAPAPPVAAASEIPATAAPVVDGKFTDRRDGKVYKVVAIGAKNWMGENLNYAAEGSVCYGNSADNCAKYGRLYELATAKTACPAGFHLPTDEEWSTLTNEVGGSNVAGAKLKSSTGWDNDGNGTDDYGFSALPGGQGNFLGGGGEFRSAGSFGGWYSAPSNDFSNAGFQEIMSNYGGVNMGIISGNGEGQFFSVRCVQD